MKTKSKRPSAPARRSRDQHRARARLLPPRAWRRYIPRGRALLTPRRRRRPFYSMGFARSAGALDIICAAGEASGSGVWRRLTRGRAQACVAWRRRAGAGREYRGAPSSARCLRAPSSQDPLSSEFRLTARHRGRLQRCRSRHVTTAGQEEPDRLLGGRRGSPFVRNSTPILPNRVTNVTDTNAAVGEGFARVGGRFSW